MTGKYFESAEVSDVGKKRKNNEDACIIIPEHGVFCIADGMGGQAGGDIASEAITTALQEAFSKAGPEDDATFGRRIALFRKAANQASKWIKNFADEKVIGQMGSTVVALVVDPRNPTRAVGLHAGDSRLYRYRKGELEQITADHSAVAALAAKLGVPQESIPAKYQNELLRAVGLTEAIELEKTPVDVASGDLYLICSDGLTKMQTDDQIAKILKTGGQEPVKTIAQTLINAANDAGGKDNVSVVLVRAGDFTGAPNVIDLADEKEDQTLTPAPDLAFETPNIPTPSSAVPDSADVHGDTPHTPTPSGKDGSAAPAQAVPGAPAPAAAPNAVPDLLASLSMDLKPAVDASNVKRDPKSGLPVIAGRDNKKKSSIGIIIVVVIILGAIIGYICTRPKQSADDVFANPVPSNAPPGPDVLANIRTSAPPANASPPSNPPAPAPDNLDPGHTALKNAQAAFDRRDYRNAAALAATALQKIPGDPTATKLQADSQTQLKIEDAWRTAFYNAQNSYNSHDYKNAAAWAAEALKAIPGEQTATKLQNNALQQLQQASATAEQNQKYQTTLQAAEDAFKKGDFSEAETSAKAALAVRPNDPAAKQIIDGIETQTDLESARRFFDEGDYDTTLQICQSHPQVDGFTQLMASCREEQTALASAKNLLGAGDYSFVTQLQSQAFARKPAFAELLGQAAPEQKLLADLQALKQAGNWKDVTARLASPAYNGVAGKASFAALGQWAKSQSSQVDNQKLLQKANVTYEQMLVWFNIKEPNDPYIKTPEARNEKRRDGMLQDQQRQQYLVTAAWLENEFGKNGVLNQNDRAKYLKELQDTIAHHE